MTREERFLNIFAMIDDKYIRLAYPYTDGVSKATDAQELTEITVSAVPVRKKKPLKFRALIASGAAAAVALAGGIAVWLNSNGSGIDPNSGSDPSVTAADDANYVPDIRNLKWGMTVEEVRAHETAVETGHNFTESNGYVFTELFYDKAELEGYDNVSMRLCVGYKEGLNMVEYDIHTGDSGRETYYKLFNELTNKYGSGGTDAPNDMLSGIAYWDVPEEGISVFLNEGDQVIQYDIFPYTEKEEEETETTAPKEPVDYTGVDVVEFNDDMGLDFDVFDKYFLGTWIYGDDRKELVLNYSVELETRDGSDTSQYGGIPVSIYTDDRFAYMCGSVGIDYVIYAVPLSDTSKMYRWYFSSFLDYDPQDQAIKPVSEYDTEYTRTYNDAQETDEYGYFGRKKLQYVGRDIECDPIDKTLDCEKILLDRADDLKTLFTDYLNNSDHSGFTEGERYTGNDLSPETYKAVSDGIRTYADFKAKFADSIDGWYFDVMNCETPRMLDINGELYFEEAMSGLPGITETWYIGYDVWDDRIIGHFAVLLWGNDYVYENYRDPDFLNDLHNYRFYDIIVQNIGGKYVITECRDTDTVYNYGGTVYQKHRFYNVNDADRSLVTNPKVKPKEYTPKRTDTGLTEEEILQIQHTLLDFRELTYSYVDCKRVSYSEKYIKTQEEYSGESYDLFWFLITDEDINTMSKLRAKLSSAMTDNMIDSLGLENYYYKEQDGALYMRDFADQNGSLLGTDRAYVTSVELKDADTLILNMHAFGSGENWDLPEDSNEDFTITMKRENGSFKVDECDLRARGFITWAYNPAYDVF